MKMKRYTRWVCSPMHYKAIEDAINAGYSLIHTYDIPKVHGKTDWAALTFEKNEES